MYNKSQKENTERIEKKKYLKQLAEFFPKLMKGFKS